MKETNQPIIIEQDNDLTSESKSFPSHRKSLLYLFLVSFFIAAIFFTLSQLGYRFNEKNLLPNQTNNKNTNKQSSYLETWINCSDVRDVVEESNQLYVACLGGVLVVDSSTGEVTNEINLVDGLSSDTVTDLELINSNLYIGTQGGLNIYNLQTKEVNQISTMSGLPSNHNIRLARDNNNIWIGTFRGLAKLDTTTGVITNYKDKIPVDNSETNIQNLHVTENAVYAYANSNAYTAGYIARYDKQTNTWSNWGGKNFNGHFVFGLNSLDGEIYVFTDRAAYSATDEIDSVLVDFTAFNKKNEAINSKDKFYRYLGSHKEYSFIFKQNSIYKYDIKKDEMTEFVSNADFGQNGPLIKKDIYTFPSSKDKPWLLTYNVDTGLIKETSLNRPSTFLDVYASIDNEVFVGTNKGMYLVDMSKEKLDFGQQNLISDLVDFEFGIDVISIASTSKVVFFGQSCEMSCNEARLVVYDHLDRTTKADNPPTTIKPNKKVTYNANMTLILVGFDKDGKLIFNNSNQDFDVKWLSYDLESGWAIETQEPAIVSKYEKSDCAPSFSFDSQGKEINSNITSCTKSEVNLPFPEGVKSLLKIQDSYIGVYTWGGLFRYTQNNSNEK